MYSFRRAHSLLGLWIMARKSVSCGRSSRPATVACECPRHLAQLISSLARFEAYSAECESRGQEDAALHSYLYTATSQARSAMENALARVVEMEGLSTKPGEES